MRSSQHLAGTLIVFASLVQAQAPDQIEVVVHPPQSDLYGADALGMRVLDAPASHFDFRGAVMNIVNQLDDTDNWIARSTHEREFLHESGSSMKGKKIATQLLRSGDADAAMLVDFIFFVSPDHRQVRVVTQLRTYGVRHGRYYAIEKLSRRYEYLSPVIDADADFDAPLLLATKSIGRMIRGDLHLLMSESKDSGERRAFYGLDPRGMKTTLRGRVFYIDGRNTVYRDSDGNLYSVPTAT